jgi:N-acetylglutamate synthase-like GNAT family acetyltransferase
MNHRDDPYKMRTQDSIQYRFVSFKSALSQEIIRECERNIIDRYGGTINNYPVSDFEVPTGSFMIGEIKNTVVACGGFHRLNKNVAELKRIFVQPAFRQQGIAQGLIMALEQRAKELGYTEIWLETATLPEDSTRLYKKMGYHEIPGFGEYVGLSGSQCFAKSNL